MADELRSAPLHAGPGTVRRLLISHKAVSGTITRPPVTTAAHRPNTNASSGPPLQMDPGSGRILASITKEADIPSRRCHRLRGKLADTTGYLLPTPLVFAARRHLTCAISMPLTPVDQTGAPRALGDLASCPSRARSHGEPPAMTDKISLTVQGNTSQLTPR
jgi:hypothetical protein